LPKLTELAYKLFSFNKISLSALLLLLQAVWSSWNNQQALQPGTGFIRTKRTPWMCRWNTLWKLLYKF